MPRLIFKGEDRDYRGGDVDTIVRACRSFGYQISPGDARAAWEEYSEGLAAGWILLPDDPARILAIVKNHTEVEDDGIEYDWRDE